jgi:hypothetical protein
MAIRVTSFVSQNLKVRDGSEWKLLPAKGKVILQDPDMSRIDRWAGRKICGYVLLEEPAPAPAPPPVEVVPEPVVVVEPPAPVVEEPVAAAVSEPEALPEVEEVEAEHTEESLEALGADEVLALAESLGIDRFDRSKARRRKKRKEELISDILGQ